MNEPVLCYVDGPWAYFTTQNLEDQWGDDWDDAPYEHNAGEPYEHLGQWEIIKVAFDGVFNRPCDYQRNSPYSVKQINAGAIAWLSYIWHHDKLVSIPAGTKLRKFVELIQKGGGNVYMEAK